MIIVGGGPAGLTAALYLAREDVSVLVVDRAALGGQAGITERIDNIPGFDAGVSGEEFAERLRRQIQRFGAEGLVAQEVESITGDGADFVVKTSLGDSYRSRAVLLAPGSTYRRLNAPGEDQLIGAGVHFCATCDGPFYKGEPVLVIGGGNSGVQEAIFLTKFTDDVTLIERGDRLKASSVLVERAESDPKLTVRLNTSVTEFKGDDRLRSVVLRDNVAGAVEEQAFSAAFLFIGLVPNTQFLRGVVDLDQWGYIKARADLKTSAAGIYAAGDARLGSTKQIVAAAGEGATAALQIREYLGQSKEM